MRIGRKRLPLKALHAFEATARHTHMGQAAEELAVSQSAISHQVRNLETELGVRLFDRSNKQLALTPDGQQLYAVVGGALDDIKRCTLNLGESGFSGKFTIAAPPAFTHLWLMPRIGELLERFPELELHFELMPRRIPQVLPEADLVVQFGKHNWPRRRVVALATTDYTPICSPRLLGQLGRASAANLSQQVLIHDDDGEAWQQWLALSGIKNLRPERNIYVSSAIDALELARSGVGIAINDQIITSHWLREGELIAPFRQKLAAFDNYYVVTPHEEQQTGAVGEFESWLRQRMA